MLVLYTLALPDHTRPWCIVPVGPLCHLSFLTHSYRLALALLPSILPPRAPVHLGPAGWPQSPQTRGAVEGRACLGLEQTDGHRSGEL